MATFNQLFQAFTHDIYSIYNNACVNNIELDLKDSDCQISSLCISKSVSLLSLGYSETSDSISENMFNSFIKLFKYDDVQKEVIYKIIDKSKDLFFTKTTFKLIPCKLTLPPLPEQNILEMVQLTSNWPWAGLDPTTIPLPEQNILDIEDLLVDPILDGDIYGMTRVI